jgi:hypothetical protein
MGEAKDTGKKLLHKDVQIAYLGEGVGAVVALWEEGRVSVHTFRRAIKFLHSSGNDALDLVSWFANNVGPIGRTKVAPKSGDTRTFKAQIRPGRPNVETDTGGVYLRLPVPDQVKPGKSLQVSFKDDKIVIFL